MKKTVLALNLLTLSISQALATEQINTISVEATKLSDVSGEEVKSADLAEALTKKLPSVSIVRRSGIANDIILRGQKKDNINILIDNTKIYGACPNRMDPPTSHVLTNTIESITIIEGPYDVENFGTLSGAVEITTQKPSEEFKGEISANMGSWDYRKLSASVSGGNDIARFLLSISNESSAQYEDGDGNNFYEQIANLDAPVGVQYKDIYRDLDAYEKSSFLGKLYLDISEHQDIKFSYTANRSDDILYPSSPMDALYDDSNIFNLEYTIRQLGEYSDALEVQYYSSDVEHPMSTFYRNSSGVDSVNETISMLTTDMQGVKIKNHMQLNDSAKLTVGVDSSMRNWDGEYIGGMNDMFTGRTSIANVDTENSAVFASLEQQFKSTHVKTGIRYDDTSITPDAASGLQDNDYSGFSANIMATFQTTDTTRFYVGVGRASRVPDARELYFTSAKNVLVGTPDLDETSNTEIDFGAEQITDKYVLRSRIFHSWLKDYIYYRDSGMDMNPNAFVNLDASIYGLEVGGSYFVNDEIFIDFGLAYLRGEKDEALEGQTDTDLAEITPLKANAAVNYEYGHKNIASLELVAASAWDDFDSDNGEQAIPGYGVVNLKVTHNFTNNFELTAGIDNLLDKSYAVTNTYKDLTLIADGSGDVMLINEPGQYAYINGTYRF